VSTLKLHAIVLKSYETGNSSEVVHVLSAEQGRLSVYARGLRSRRNRHAAILQPLALVELTLMLKEGAEMGTLRDAAPLGDQSAITSDLERFSLGLLLAEAASSSCGVAQPAPELFSALLRALHELDPRSGLSAPVAACRGMLAVLAVAGYEPQVDDALLQAWPDDKPKPLCFWLDAEAATIHARGAQPREAPVWPTAMSGSVKLVPLPPRAVRFVYEVGRGNMAPLSAEEAHQLLEGLIRLCEFHHEGPLRSAGFWRELG
jgi:hypothetical protein